MCTFWTLCSHVCEPNLSWKVLENEFCKSCKTLEFGLCKSWKVLENILFTVCTNPVQLYLQGGAHMYPIIHMVPLVCTSLPPLPLLPKNRHLDQLVVFARLTL